jgi:hypothetical protein
LYHERKVCQYKAPLVFLVPLLGLTDHKYVTCP